MKMWSMRYILHMLVFRVTMCFMRCFWVGFIKKNLICSQNFDADFLETDQYQAVVIIQEHSQDDDMEID